MKVLSLALMWICVLVAAPLAAQTPDPVPVDSWDLPLAIADDIVTRLNSPDLDVRSGDVSIPSGVTVSGNLAVLDGSLDTAMEKGRIKMRDDPAEGWRAAAVAEWNGDVAGTLIAYRVEGSLADIVCRRKLSGQRADDAQDARSRANRGSRVVG